mmetsp:Transcript_28123/g.54874  ORF Transcript_28123/g.54874 Transcript_28123/m.54874 type:complete len:286 (-) Transcript_28123:257-1114(-)
MGRAGGTQVAAVPRTRASNRSASPASRDPSPTKTPSARGGSSSPSAALARGSPGVRRRRTSNNCERSASPGVQTRSQADGEPLEMLAGDGVTPKNQSFDTLWGGVEAMLQPPQIEGGEPPAKLMETPATRPCFGHIMAPTRRRKRDIVRPFLIKGLMSGVIYMMGEAIACGLLCRKGVYGFYPRAFIKYSVLHSALVGALANGPMLQLFFHVRRLPRQLQVACAQRRVQGLHRPGCVGLLLELVLHPADEHRHRLARLRVCRRRAGRRVARQASEGLQVGVLEGD